MLTSDKIVKLLRNAERRYLLNEPVPVDPVLASVPKEFLEKHLTGKWITDLHDDGD
jgi:hypothetical protein